MVFKSFPLSFSRFGIFFTISTTTTPTKTTTTCLEDDQNNNTTNPLPWVLLLLTSTIFVYALCYGFHLLTFLITCFALLAAPFATPLLRPTSTPPTPPKTNSLKEQECSESEECSESDDEDPDPAQQGSDGSISDEESLIEIALPSGYYIDPKRHNDHKQQQQPLPVRCGLQQNWWADCYSMESFQQQSLMAELLAEINDFYEEDNMIEIDLSMGSIKCPRFEIKA